MMRKIYSSPKSNCVSLSFESSILSASNVYQKESDATPFTVHKRGSGIWNSMDDKNDN